MTGQTPLQLRADGTLTGLAIYEAGVRRDAEALQSFLGVNVDQHTRDESWAAVITFTHALLTFASGASGMHPQTVLAFLRAIHIQMRDDTT